MKQPNRDHLEWSSFTSRFAALLTWLPMLCFWVVVGGSVYGIQKSIESQHPGAGLLIALAAAIVIQTLNRVSVHFSTRWIASWFVGREQLRANTHQKVKIVDGAVGLACLLFTGSICYFDFRANREASEKAAQNLVSAPDTIRVDANANAPAIHAAQLLANQTHADTTNIGRAIAYEAKKQSYSMAMFWLYITAMLLWHLCHALKSYLDLS